MYQDGECSGLYLSLKPFFSFVCALELALKQGSLLTLRVRELLNRHARREGSTVKTEGGIVYTAPADRLNHALFCFTFFECQ
jgi:hypothetical protein